ncbi:hypothetical protein A2316_04100 [Candidatus Falkowbacteria bacterium RIFOXYB2_FULL_38_15]|uniref:Uncharacterized protein n=1 Tax=Candidatus Falkowbacteria bacterium RIFOXYA2_FULL_38_12 TaxID=1797993 RepID=A0A1F5S2H0_9BACT|nr:MAG: hypothetical protein A2257_03245 [Candidatus Falkowbacteria bacterium RIFOXYA2_FULL_38_12]OGF33671.1 MAG: hypothetical protein A2316_04100 [Candidatus Falkowbacteria bacterium RIFOXYB2_FULL_38_15]OGF42032.1 MAG: hypothetical protein A2555_01360 [Candidatus Falkowbacteria bacterium RIFOXYD2_FULL_39_16]
MSDVDLIWEELISRFDFGLPEDETVFKEEAESVINEFVESGKISEEDDMENMLEALEVKRKDSLIGSVI